jgi:type I restriction enzyme M protein
MHERAETWSEANPEDRWRCFDYDALTKRDKVNLDISWLKDDSLDDPDLLPPLDEIAAEIVGSLKTALESFRKAAASLLPQNGDATE